MTQVPTNSVIALTAERAATMSWYDEMVAAGRSKSLPAGNVRCGVAAVHEVLGSLALETPVNCHSELMEEIEEQYIYIYVYIYRISVRMFRAGSESADYI